MEVSSLCASQSVVFHEDFLRFSVDFQQPLGPLSACQHGPRGMPIYIDICDISMSKGTWRQVVLVVFLSWLPWWGLGFGIGPLISKRVSASARIKCEHQDHHYIYIIYISHARTHTHVHVMIIMWVWFVFWLVGLKEGWDVWLWRNRPSKQTNTPLAATCPDGHVILTRTRI